MEAERTIEPNAVDLVMLLELTKEMQRLHNIGDIEGYKAKKAQIELICPGLKKPVTSTLMHEGDSYVSGICLFCKGAHSFAIGKTSKKFYCFNCKAAGDIIDLYKALVKEK